MRASREFVVDASDCVLDVSGRDIIFRLKKGIDGLAEGQATCDRGDISGIGEVV